jgi:PAS domain S-box-containing protein
MKTTATTYSPLLSFDIFLDHYHKTIKQLKSKADIAQMKNHLPAIVTDSIETRIHEEYYDAIVVTDIRQNIVWVSEGFYEMTGYSSRYAIGKQPSFLQGKDTQEATKKSIRINLDKDHSFTGSIINYKKNGEEYLCQLKLFPLKNKKNQVTHYLALERRLEAA